MIEAKEPEVDEILRRLRIRQEEAEAKFYSEEIRTKAYTESKEVYLELTREIEKYEDVKYAIGDLVDYLCGNMYFFEGKSTRD